MQKASEMMRVRAYTLAEADKLAERDDVDRTRVAAAAIDAFGSLPTKDRKELYAKHKRSRGVHSPRRHRPTSALPQAT